MTALPPVAEVVLATILVLAVLRAFVGPPPGQTDPFAAGAWMSAGILLLATVLIAGDAARPRDLLCAAAVLAVCVAGWWMRSRSDDDGGEERQEPGPTDPEIDWDEFDRQRDGWSRPPSAVG